MISVLAVSSLLLGVAGDDDEDLDELFKRAYLLNQPKVFWQHIPEDRLVVTMDSIFDQLVKTKEVYKLQRILGPYRGIFEQWARLRFECDLLDDSLFSFVDDYLKTALWSSSDEKDVAFDKNFDVDDVAYESQIISLLECKKFLQDNAEDIRKAKENGATDSQIAHDFWLTRHHHGTGFWDRGEVYPEGVGDSLSEASKRFKEKHVYESAGVLYVE